MTMAASIEARVPFLDHELAAFVSSLPGPLPRARTGAPSGSCGQAARQAASRSASSTRPKVGFRVPVNEWFRGPMRDFLLDHLQGPASMTRAYYDATVLDGVLADHSSGRQNHEKLLWTLLNLEIWHRHYARPELAESGGLDPAAGARALAAARRWRINRLRCMTPAEIPHRLLRAAVGRCAERCGCCSAPPPVPAARSERRPQALDSRHRQAWMPRCTRRPPSASPRAGWTCSRCATPTSARRRAGTAIPKTGIEAPLGFGKLLDYRDPRLVGDIKYLWEPNRHLHLVTLAQAYALGGDARYLRVMRRASGELVRRLPLSAWARTGRARSKRRCA